MNSSSEEFESQVVKLVSTLKDLESEMRQVRDLLKTDTDNANLRSRQRQLNLDIRITSNELEDFQARLGEHNPETV